MVDEMPESKYPKVMALYKTRQILSKFVNYQTSAN